MRVLGIALGVFVLLLIMLGIIPDLFLIPFALLFGWIPATVRLGGNFPFSTKDLGLFFAVTALLVCGVHWFLRQFRPWRSRWTLAITGGVGLVLLAIMGVVGFAHQFGWILLSHEPLFVNRSRGIRDQLYLMKVAQLVGSDTRTNGVNRSQQILCDASLPNMHDGKRAWEKCNLLFIEPTNGCFAVVWLRDASLHQQIGSACVYTDGRVLLDRRNSILKSAQLHAPSNH